MKGWVLPILLILAIGALLGAILFYLSIMLMS